MRSVPSDLLKNYSNLLGHAVYWQLKNEIKVRHYSIKTFSNIEFMRY